MSTPVRRDAAELAESRRRLEGLVGDLPGGRPGEMAFNEPWEIRAFAMAVAMHQSRQFEWPEFQHSLIQSIGDWERAHAATDSDPWSYYEHWVTALESVLARIGLLSESALDERTKTVLSTPRDAHHQGAHPDPIAIDPALG